MNNSNNNNPVDFLSAVTPRSFPRPLTRIQECPANAGTLAVNLASHARYIITRPNTTEAAACTNSSTTQGWQAWFARWRVRIWMVTHPGTNRAHHCLTSLIETSYILQRPPAPPPLGGEALKLVYLTNLMQVTSLNMNVTLLFHYDLGCRGLRTCSALHVSR